jgi:hypothetical protein
MCVSGNTAELYPKMSITIIDADKIRTCLTHLKIEEKTVRSGLRKGERHLHIGSIQAGQWHRQKILIMHLKLRTYKDSNINIRLIVRSHFGRVIGNDVVLARSVEPIFTAYVQPWLFFQQRRHGPMASGGSGGDGGNGTAAAATAFAMELRRVRFKSQVLHESKIFR